MTQEERKEYNYQYHQKHKERLKEKQREYYKEHKKEILARNLKWRINNPDKVKICAQKRIESSKTYREKNKEKIRVYYAEWYKNNGRKRYPIPITNIRRAKPLNVGMHGTFTKDQARKKVSQAIISGILTRPEECSVCHAKIKLQAHHIDYSKPLEVQWVCKKCHVEIHKKA